MSKSDRNTSNKLSPVAVAVAAIYPALKSEAQCSERNAGEAKSRSATVVAAIKTLWETAEDKVAAGIATFGDGLSTKESVKGELWTKLHADGVKSGQVYNTLAWGRTVYAHFGHAEVRKAALESGLRKARDVAKPKAKAEASEKAEAAPSSSTDIAEFVHRNFDAVLVAMQAEFIRMRDPISLAKLGEINIHLASKTKAA